MTMAGSISTFRQYVMYELLGLRTGKLATSDRFYSMLWKAMNYQEKDVFACGLDSDEGVLNFQVIIRKLVFWNIAFETVQVKDILYNPNILIPAILQNSSSGKIYLILKKYEADGRCLIYNPSDDRTIVTCQSSLLDNCNTWGIVFQQTNVTKPRKGVSQGRGFRFLFSAATVKYAMALVVLALTLATGSGRLGSNLIQCVLVVAGLSIFESIIRINYGLKYDKITSFVCSLNK